jgi:hypothetical protein
MVKGLSEMKLRLLLLVASLKGIPRMNRYIVILLAGVLLSAPAQATDYSAEAIDAQIVDAKTKQPLEGVIVVAHWEVRRVVPTFVPIMPFGNDPRGPFQLQIMETVTDANGRFHFPAWGPLPVPPLAALGDRDPHLIFFKEGYVPWSISNGHPTTFDYSASSTRSSELNGTTIKLKKFEGDLKAYAAQFGMLSVNLNFATYTRIGNCDWKRIPRMLGTVIKIKRSFREKLIYSALPNLDSIQQGECGSAEEWLKDYLK